MRKVKEQISRVGGLVVTGGSSGIGRAIVMASRKLVPSLPICNLSRSKPERFPGDGPLVHIECDLADRESLRGAAEGVKKTLRESFAGKPWILVNNSGFGSYGPFPEPGLSHHEGMLDLNVIAPVWLTGELLPELQKSGGSVINVASTAAFQPTPFMATYGASKAFVLHWSLALNADLKGTGVRVLCVCPGPTESQFFKRAGFDDPPMGGGIGMTAEAVAEQTWKAWARGRSLVVTGWKNRVLTGLSGVLPPSLQTAVAYRVLKATRMDQLTRKP